MGPWGRCGCWKLLLQPYSDVSEAKAVDMGGWGSSRVALDDQTRVRAEAHMSYVQKETGGLEEVRAEVRGLHVSNHEDPVVDQVGGEADAEARDAMHGDAGPGGRCELDVGAVHGEVGARRRDADACAGVNRVDAAVVEVGHVDDAGHRDGPREGALGLQCREPDCPFFEQGGLQERALSPNLSWK